MNYCVLHHQFRSYAGLQVADYCNWAIYRKWSKGDLRSYERIKLAVRSESEIFKTGRTYGY
jgi:hypothetical protein